MRLVSEGQRVIRNPSSGLRYGVAGIAAVVALAVRLALDPVLGTHSPYLPFTIAVIVAARFGGRGPGFVCTALSALGVVFVFIEPRYSLLIADRHAAAGLVLFLIVGSFVAVLVGHLRESLRSAGRAEEALRGKTQLVDCSHDAIITADPDRRITGWNAGATQLYGWTESEVRGNTIGELLRSQNGATADQFLLRDGHWDGELIHTGRDGRQIVVESRQILVRSGDGSAAGIMEINRDITARKRAEEKLVEQHRKNVALLDSISDGFNAFDREWRYTYVNPPAAKMVGKTPEELLGKVLWELWPSAVESPFGAAYRRAVVENNPVQVEAFYPEPLNKWFEVRCYPSSDGLSLFFTDTTERHHAAERLRQTQKLESIGVLAGGVAHDFNNILTVIMGNASDALAECPSCERCKAILSASERASYLTRQLLAYAGKGRTVAEVVDLTELVAKSMGLLSASIPKRVDLVFKPSPGLPCLEADPSQIEQVLMNLAMNAAEAIAPRNDGMIEIATSSFDVTPEMARQHSTVYDVVPGPYVCLQVRDDGAGMDEATVGRIFDPFFSTKFTGRGLGLAAMQGIVRISRGFIDVQSVPGAGTTFRVFLPASDKRRATNDTGTIPLQRVHGASTILVVDDEEMIRNLARVALKRYGYEVHEAQDGKDALRVLAECSVLPSLALLDLAMPVMGGDELVSILAERYPDMKIIMTSGFPEEEARKHSPAGSMTGFLQKPYTGVMLAEKIAEVLGDLS